MHRFKNDGRYVLGVPARDVSDDEWTALSDDERDRADDVYEHQAGEPPTTDTPTNRTPETRRRGN